MPEKKVIELTKGLKVHLVDGAVSRIEDASGSEANEALSNKERAAIEALNHPDRLEHPLKRLGSRGENRWHRVSWEEALDTIADELLHTKNTFGPESVTFISGHWQSYQDAYFKWLADTFGTPNMVNAAHVCHAPSTFASRITCGFSPSPDYDYPPACVVLWGINVKSTHHPLYPQIREALNQGSKSIVVDPFKTEMAEKADCWLQLRPGTDVALALAMIHVIVNEELYDEAFVDRWTFGFDRLIEHIQDYSPEWAAKITWVAADGIKEAARLYAKHKPARIEDGNALHHNVNSFQGPRAISILRAITGNLCLPGGEVMASKIPVVESHELVPLLGDKIPSEKRLIRAGSEHNLIPLFPFAFPPSIVKAILEDDPYPIRAAFIKSSNPLLTWSNARRVYKALCKLDFLAVADMFMTPTAALADIVLPAAGLLEFDSIKISESKEKAEPIEKIEQIGERRSGVRIIIELAEKLGLGEYFPDTEEDHLNNVLKSAGVNFEDFKNKGVIHGVKQPGGYDQDGFRTPSGKVELFSNQLMKWGFDPLPKYDEPPETPYSDSKLAEQYPFIATSYKSSVFVHSQGRQLPSLRTSHPEPVTCIHPGAAEKLGIRQGDWIYIETRLGRIRQRAALSPDVDPRVIFIDYGWWFPEKGANELYGWTESNINILTDDEPPYNREMGSTRLRPFLCKVYKQNEQAHISEAR